ncbi:MFS transporter, partial [Erwinia sp. PsM31]|nr:MFS transporter [Erwinia sp. PsM31]
DNPLSFFYYSLVFSVLCDIVLTLVYSYTSERPAEKKSAPALAADQQKQTLAQSLGRQKTELISTLRIP